MPPAENVADRRENVFLRWACATLAGAVVLLGTVAWNRTEQKVEALAAQQLQHAMQLQALQLDAAADRRSTAVLLAGIQQWLQAIGQRLNVQQPPPTGTGAP